MKMNSNPKSRVESKFLELFGDKISFGVTGCREHRGLSDTRIGYRTQIIVDNHVIAEAVDKDWRRSYKKLMFEIEKLYIEGIALV
jgi:hypothetical protein